MVYRKIDIDFDVHKCIEGARRGFEETPNDVLRRLLQLGEVQPSPTSSPPPRPSLRGRSWLGDGVELVHGTATQMSYGDRVFKGQIIDGEWVVGDRKFDSPSGAASAIALTKKGKTTRLNGWKYWEVKAPGEDVWTPLESLRPEAPVTLTAEELGL
jgi:hypothetical protein